MQIEFHRGFKKRYRQIPSNIRLQFDERLRLFEQESYHPALNNHALSGDRLGQWSINVTGDWRAVYFFQDDAAVVFIDIDRHSNLYK